MVEWTRVRWASRGSTGESAVPVATSHPGTYIQEIPSGVRTIVGPATSVTAFVGRAPRGPIGTPVRCSSWAEFDRRFDGLWADSELGYVVQHYFLNGGGTAVVSRVDDDATAARFDLATAGGPLVLSASSPGGWGNDVRITVDHGTPETVSEPTDDQSFHLTVRRIDPEVLAATGDLDRATREHEVHANLSVDPDSPRAIATYLEQVSALVRVTTTPGDRPGELEAVGPGTAGVDGTAVAADDTAHEAAIDALDQADVVNLVSVPPPTHGQTTSLATWTHAVAWAAAHRAVVLVDPPDTWADADAAAALAGGFDSLRSPNSTFWYPRVIAADPLRDGLARPFAPGGAVAGMIARTDAAQGVWTAPAGQDASIRGTAGLERAVVDGDSELLNPRGVNALRELPVVGPVAWGARTGVGADALASEWKYLPVRRIALHIETALERGLRWAVFEPNDLPLWREMHLAVTSFMQDLFRRGAFRGTSPRDAYLVKCDAETTTPADVEAGIVHLLVGFAPLKPAEFVILSFTQLAGQDGG